MAKPGTSTVMPRLRFPEFRQTSGWNAKILGDEGEFLSTLTGKTAEHFGTGTAKYVTYMNVFANTFADMAKLGIVDVGGDELQNAVEAGDVLFTVSSETPEEAGMSSVVIDAVPNCYVNSFCAMFRFADGDQPNLHFLGYSLRQPFARRHFVKRAQGSTRFNLSKAAFRSLPLALPSPAEQQKIADCLTSLDEVIAAQGQQVEALKTHKRGLMQQLFPREGETRPRLRFPEFRGAPGWTRKILGKEGEFLSSLTGKSAQHFGVGCAKYVTYMNVFSNIFTDMALLGTVDVEPDESQNAVATGDVLFTVSSETPEEAGMSSVVLEGSADCYLNSFCTLFRFGAEKRPNLRFLGFLLRQPVVRKYLAERAQGSTRFNLSKAAFRSLPITVPSTAEQQKIADILSFLGAQIAAESDKLDALKTHKNGLMQQLFPSPEGA